MERTLEIMEAELKATNKQLKPLQKKANELEREIEQYKLDNALYHPMSELINYKGKDIFSIELVVKNWNGALETEYMCEDEIFEVTDDGHLYYSSYGGGIIQYDCERDKYIHYYYGHGTECNYVGFLTIKVRD